MHVAIVGGGITGLATARTLVDAGHRVTLVERDAGPGQGASRQNGGQLSYAFVAPLAAPSTLRALPRLLLDPASPLRFSVAEVLREWRWCWAFARACTASRAAATTRALLSLSALSRERFSAWRRQVPDSRILFRRNGKLVVLRSAAAWTDACRQVELQRAIGPGQQLCGAEQCREIEPALAADRGRIAGGVYTPSEEVADCAAVCEVLAEGLAAQDAFSAAWNTEAVRLNLQAGRVVSLSMRSPQGWRELHADAFVVASGAQARALLAPLGLRVPVVPLKGYSVDLPAAALGAMPRVSITDSAIKTVYAPLDSGAGARLRVAGMAELRGLDRQVDPRRVQQLVHAALALFGQRGAIADVRPWSGLRPATPTGLPCIGGTRLADNLFANVGQGALGFTLAFGSAALLAAALAGSGEHAELARHFPTDL